MNGIIKILYKFQSKTFVLFFSLFVSLIIANLSSISDDVKKNESIQIVYSNINIVDEGYDIEINDVNNIKPYDEISFNVKFKLIEVLKDAFFNK